MYRLVLLASLFLAVRGASWTNDTAVLYSECLVVPPCATEAFAGRAPELALFAALGVRTGNAFLAQPAWWPNATLADQAVYAAWVLASDRRCSADQFVALGPGGTFKCICRPGIECAHPQSTHVDTIIAAMLLLFGVAAVTACGVKRRPDDAAAP